MSSRDAGTSSEYFRLNIKYDPIKKTKALISFSMESSYTTLPSTVNQNREHAVGNRLDQHYIKFKLNVYSTKCYSRIY